jgi:hypothetical protein
MPYYTIPLIVATIASGATAALFHLNSKMWRGRCRTLETVQQQHLATIFELQKRLRKAGLL